MSKTRNLSDLLDANGDVKSGALDNVPDSTNASALSSGTVAPARLGSGTASSTTFLAGDSSYKTVSGTTINNNADNRVITGSGTANTLEGEANLNYTSPNLTVTGGNPSIIHNNTTSGGDTGIKFQGSGVDYGFVNLDNSDGALDLGTVVNWSVRFFSNNAETFRQNTSTTKFNYAGTHDVRSYGWVGNGSGQGWKLQRDSNQGSINVNRNTFNIC